MLNKCTKCGNTENYNFALNIGLCNPCIGERLEKLEAKNEQLGKWQIKPTEAICLTDLSCRYKKVFKND